VICLKYIPLNTAYNVGISTTLILQISTQHAVVSRDILHIYLFSFNIAQPIRMLQKTTTPSVTRRHGSCTYDIFVNCNWVVTRWHL